jgi:hypothetical protein
LRQEVERRPAARNADSRSALRSAAVMVVEAAALLVQSAVSCSRRTWSADRGSAGAPARSPPRDPPHYAARDGPADGHAGPCARRGGREMANTDWRGGRGPRCAGEGLGRERNGDVDEEHALGCADGVKHSKELRKVP